MSRSLLQADEHTALWFALRVRNHGNKEMNLKYSHENTTRNMTATCRATPLAS